MLENEHTYVFFPTYNCQICDKKLIAVYLIFYDNCKFHVIYDCDNGHSIELVFTYPKIIKVIE